MAHSNAVEVERGVAQSVRILFIAIDFLARRNKFEPKDNAHRERVKIVASWHLWLGEIPADAGLNSSN